MSKPDSTQASETLHEIESIFDRVAGWTSSNPVPVLATLAVVLLVAASLGGYRAWRADREAGASAEIAAIEAEYQRAMGARPGELEVPEPANAEAARETREEYATRLAEAADGRRGTRAAVTARLRAGSLLEEAGNADGALAAFRAAADEAPAGSTLGALARVQLAGALEKAGDLRGAAEAHLAAGQVDAFPGRVLALGDAARCFAEAGDNDRALEVYARLTPEEVKKLPVYVAARLAELRVRTSAKASSGGAEAP